MNEPAPNVLLLGLPGAGKTDAVATLVEAGMEVFVIFTEQGRESLLEGAIRRGVDKDKLHWAYVGAATPGSKGLKTLFKEISTKDQSALQKSENLGGAKNYDQILDLIDLLNDFVDQNGVHYGDVESWGNGRALVIDGLSGINDMAMNLVVGGKPIKSIADWGIAMDSEMSLIKNYVNSTTCMFVLIGHLELNKDEVSGRIEKMPKLLGNKNSADFGKYWSDVVLAKDTGNDFVWSTQENGMQLKTRNLERGVKLEPSFVPLVKKWAGRYETGGGDEG